MPVMPVPTSLRFALGAGVRFSLGWWAGQAFGLLAASIVMLALLAQTSTLYARLLRDLRVEKV